MKHAIVTHFGPSTGCAWNMFDIPQTN